MSNNDNLALQRIANLLAYIHQHIEQPLTLNLLAKQSCWSRWQLQRVFQLYTGYTVAQYVRTLKLSRGAELILNTQNKVNDVAFKLGFNSEISFSRAFKQHFSISPKAYQQRGLSTGIVTPLANPRSLLPPELLPQQQFMQVTIQYKDTFTVQGICQSVLGLMAEQPDFKNSIPKAWRLFTKSQPKLNSNSILYGVFDASQQHTNGSFSYWAGTKVEQNSRSTQASINVAAQHYAVISYQGKSKYFFKSVLWLIGVWLPNSQYHGVDNAHEFECYLPPLDPTQQQIQAQYWLPIKKA